MCGIWFGINSDKNISHAIQKRGPDETIHINAGIHDLVFHRLRIHDLVSGSQPFVLQTELETIYCMVNGEIYNYEEIQQQEQFELQSKSDCEVVIHLYKKYGPNFYTRLSGEFAVVILHQLDGLNKIFAFRDHVGVKPLFYGISENQFGICSEAKGLVHFEKVFVLEPRLIYSSNWYKEFQDFHWNSGVHLGFPKSMFVKSSIETKNVLQQVNEHLTRAVITRLSSDRPIGAFLSGGLDSSIVCAIAARELKKVGQQLNVFTIALPNSTDLPYAKMVAEYIGAKHHIFHITEEDALQAIDETIYATETFDTTTIRASTMQFLLSKYISEKTDIKVVLVGELSDELFNGYLYSHGIKNKLELRQDAMRLVNEIHYYDGLRTERTTAYHGLEVRVPFSDLQLIESVFNSELDSTFPQEGFEKFLLRKAFDENLLPKEVLWRRKEAFSDACSSKEKSWYQIIQDEIEKRISDEQFKNRKQYSHMNPMTKEQFYYRQVFENKFGEKCETLIPHFWVPVGMNVVNNEPSARVYFDI